MLYQLTDTPPITSPTVARWQVHHDTSGLLQRPRRVPSSAVLVLLVTVALTATAALSSFKTAPAAQALIQAPPTMLATTCRRDCGTSAAIVELAFKDNRLSTERDDEAFCLAAVADPVMKLVITDVTPGVVRCGFSVQRADLVIHDVQTVADTDAGPHGR